MRRKFRNTSRWLPRIVAVLLAVTLTAAVMHISMDRGRLASFPRVDDVLYMARGAELWQAGLAGWARGGVVQMLRAVGRDWRMDPPHGPWASVCAAMGFGVFGVKEWAAYVFTGVPVLAFLLAAGRIARRAGGRLGWRSGVLVVFAASAPFLAASVQNLKPDYAAGIASAIGMMVLLRGPLLRSRWQRLAWAGLWFGLALLAKPAMLLATGLLLAGTLGACGLRDVVIAWPARMHGRWGWTIARGARAGAIVAGIAAIVALPHYWFAIGRVWAYSAGILEGDDWAFQGSLWDRLVFYLTGPGGRLMLDGRRTLIGLAVLIGWYGWIAWRGHSRRRLATLGAMLLALGMAWAGPTVARVLIAHFAAAFDALLWLVAVYAAAEMVKTMNRPRLWMEGEAILRGTRGGMIVGWLVMAAIVATWRPTFAMLPREREGTETPARVRIMQRDGLVREVYAAMLAAGKERVDWGGGVRVLLAGSPSDLGISLVTLWSIRDGGGGERWRVRELRRVPEGVTGDPARTTEAIALRFFAESDLVVVYEPGVSLVHPKFATKSADSFYLEMARTHPEFERAARVMDGESGKSVEIYERKRSVGR